MLKGKRIILRGYKEEDAKLAWEYVNDLEVKKLLSMDAPFPITLREEEEWITKKTSNSSLTYDFAIEDKDTGKYIGGCGINSTDLKNRNCMIGIMIGDKEYWNKGYGTETLELLVSYIFEELNMHKINLGVFSFNDRAIACYKKVGFVEEGRFKEQIFRDGKYFDEIRMSIFAKDYFIK